MGLIALKVATPLTALTVRMLVPPNAVALLVMLTLRVSPVTVLPLASATFTVTAGLIAAPGAVLDGWIPKTSLLGTPGLTSKDWVPVFPDAVTISVIPVPAVVGVTLAPPSTPAVNASEVPVMPAVPL